MTASRSSASRAVRVSDEETADEDVLIISAPSPSHRSLKRKNSDQEVEAEVGEKVVWTSDSDASPELESVRKQRKKEKGKSVVRQKGKSKDKAKAKTKEKAKESAKPGAKKSRRSLVDLQDRIKDVEESEEREIPESRIPESLRRRRREFEQTRTHLQEAGLRLPPDFSDIRFPEDDDIGNLEERPQFPENGFIKPCRTYADVELEASAGIIPPSIAQYLRDYQIVGVKFLHQLFVYQRGGILGDDMGLGKTVQVAAFLAAAFGKTGDERDAKRMRRIRRLEGEERWYPRVLIVCPGTLIENWKQELQRWGWWVLDTYHGASKDDILGAAASGRLEIMITTYDTYKVHRDKINAVQWDACVADECHAMKDRSSATTRAMTEINTLCRIGLTGTAIQNNYEELWTLLDWSNPGMVGTAAEWKQCISDPLKIGQSHDATLKQLSLARTTAKKLVNNLLPKFFLRRMKSLIRDQLPKKSDKVVFCPLTSIQQRAYETYLASSDMTLLRTAHDLCPCASGMTKGECCHQYLPDGETRWHALIFPALINLMKIARHILLVLPDSSSLPEKQKKDLHLLQTCLPHEWESLSKQRDSLAAFGNPDFCGKWKVLRKMLKYWHENGDKVLIFSHSVRLLKILNHLFSNTSYSTSYLDGSLKYEERQRVVDDFNSDPAQFVFLISVKAGGTGLNINSANKVVIFDPHWNPSWDLQAQDRAYRIGQARDVDVFRLVSAGTIEEIVYARQIYKQQQANIGYSASTERRYFKGVQQEKDRKGELFGLENLFTYHATSVILQDIVNKTNIAEAKAGVNLMSVDMDEIIADAPGGSTDDRDIVKKEENDETGGLSQIARQFAQDEQSDKKKGLGSFDSSNHQPKVSPIQAILASAGVEYTHENSEVIGSSKVEASLSRRAELAATIKPDSEEEDDGPAPDSLPLFAADDDDDEDSGDFDSFPGLNTAFPESRGAFASATGDTKTRRLRYRPPLDVQKRQFCSMAREFGFSSATDFALVIESWTQEQRRDCLEKFYARREAMLAIKAEAEEETEDERDVKMEGVKTDIDLKIKKSKEDADDDEVVVMDDIPLFVKKEEETSMEKKGLVVKKDSSLSEKEKEKTPVVFLDDEETEDDDAEPELPDQQIKAEEAPQPVITATSRGTIFIYDDNEEETDEL